MKDWHLAEVIKYAFHRWPIIVAFILVGGLVGAAFSIIWPAPYRAVTEIFVGLDAFRAVKSRYVGEYANLEFRFPDDYKRWQMAQLNDLALSEDYLTETLARLQIQKTIWNQPEPMDLRNLLSVHWRDPGRWQLVAELNNPDQSKHLVETWKEVILEKTNAAIASSQDLYLLDIRLQVLENEKVRIRLETIELNEIKEILIRFHSDIEMGVEDDVIGERLFVELTTLSAQVGVLVPGWSQLGNEVLAPNTTNLEAFLWIEQANTLINRRLEVLSSQLDSLKQEHIEGLNQWKQSLYSGRGLAATLIIEDYSGGMTRVSQPRSPGTAALIGGMFGLLIWGFIVLIQINQRDGQ